MMSAAKSEALDRAKSLGFFKLIGLQIVDIDAGWCKAQLTWREDLAQPAGLLHGGVSASLVNATAAHAVLLTKRCRDVLDAGGSLLGVELRMRYLRPVKDGVVVCQAAVTRLSDRRVFVEASVCDAQGLQVAAGECEFVLRLPKPIKVELTAGRLPSPG